MLLIQIRKLNIVKRDNKTFPSHIKKAAFRLSSASITGATFRETTLPCPPSLLPSSAIRGVRRGRGRRNVVGFLLDTRAHPTLLLRRGVTLPLE